MDKDEILREIQAILTGMEKGTIHADSDLSEEGILDSIELIDFFISVEKKFGIKIVFEEISNTKLNKIDKLIELIESK